VKAYSIVPAMRSWFEAACVLVVAVILWSVPTPNFAYDTAPTDLRLDRLDARSLSEAPVASHAAAPAKDQARFPRSSGVLLHPTSLPGPYGIGDLGPEARRFVDFLALAGQTLWQTLPIGPTGYGDSPYQGMSALAGNPLLVSPDELVRAGLLPKEELLNVPSFPQDKVQFEAVIEFKNRLLSSSFRHFRNSGSAEQRADFARFVELNRSWLDDYAMFRAVSEHHKGAPWTTWERGLALREPDVMRQWRERLSDEIEKHKFVQYQFFSQWRALKSYANSRGVRIVGDIPIFVSHNSVDVWANPRLFEIDEHGEMTLVAGVPPDPLNRDGQVWGTPLYHWPAHAADGYKWWIERFRMMLRLADIVRVDHFRGFAACWAVPAYGIAANGQWVSSPGDALFRSLRAALGDLPIIVEDIGVITPDVEALRDGFGLPGVKVLQAAFDSEATPLDLPHRFVANSVVYTSTHDSDTIRGWIEKAEPKERERALQYVGSDGKDMAWDIIRLAESSVSCIAIAPVWDLLNLGSEARMNRPGVALGNWSWRFTQGQLDGKVAARIRKICETSGRVAR